ncbi:PLP-dependent aminotransferase family protein [Streptomyces subrutilus]|uniref:GntR family transcriptional regulator n=1 Tax=Streptomyces subrutilus TaxID=36818 RepID=A0A5P2UKJ2_9ACTN|nr:PLP-dependent aminotransferase family protein [Streptomyces subrutilus]QEU78161.1 PLP-dependent aminotransferase family protein [Streptomyces subrutilus]WSJ32692.1 PLP-dependent aminotransferase family protein [Streptomyces subrutilus]GGZ55482.1 GntR family transcriptional regulator [Streptomyces subrutilus]
MTWHVTLEVRRDTQEPLGSQIADQLRRQVEQGRLAPRSRLPSSRQLAQDLKVSRSVVVEVYEKLTGEGLLESVRGSGTRVAAHADTRIRKPVVLVDRVIPSARFNLLPGTPNPATFPHREWMASYQRAVTTARYQGLGYPPLLGVEQLRTELVAYLGRVRGVLGHPDNTMVTGGFAHGLGLICAALSELGIDRLAVEDPSHDRQRQFVEENGIRTLAVPVGPEGVEIEQLYASRVRAVLVTPSHQFPLGVPMSPNRQQELVRWARDTGGWIIEDDYDGGLWLEHRGRHLALQPADPERVIYAGTASKLLAPGLRLGWLVLPPPLTSMMEAIRVRRDLGGDGLMQLAFADFLRSGLLDGHLRKMRTRYLAQHAMLTQAVEQYLPAATLVGPVAGLHVLAALPPRTDEERLVAEALQRSVLVKGSRAYYDDPATARPGLVLGYTALGRSGISEAIRRIGGVYTRQSDGTRPTGPVS